MRRLDLTGKRFGMWTVHSFAHSNGRTLWNCICDCGTERIVRGYNLIRGRSKSCGCIKKKGNPGKRRPK